jgi:predicted nuclease of predicted toxin-antitoxin system
MRFLADENFPGPVIRALRDRGHDVFSVRREMQGAADEQILNHANNDARIILTFDKDFGELAFRLAMPARCGIILFRLSSEKPANDNARALAAIESMTEWSGHFAVVTDDRIRVRRLPIAGP